MKRGFGSDNHSGVCPEVLEAIARVNKDHAVAYGDDEYCAATEAKFREQFGEQARVFFAFNGTGCNTLCRHGVVPDYARLPRVVEVLAVQVVVVVASVRDDINEAIRHRDDRVSGVQRL